MALDPQPFPAHPRRAEPLRIEMAVGMGGVLPTATFGGDLDCALLKARVCQVNYAVTPDVLSANVLFIESLP